MNRDQLLRDYSEIIDRWKPVIEAARACVHGWSEDMSDGSTNFREPFNHTACALLHERVVALEAEEE